MNYFDNPDRKPLHECTDAEIAFLVRAGSSGTRIECYSISIGKWVPWGRIFLPHVIYRVPEPPMRKTVYPWHAVRPECGQWAAVEGNGTAYFYEIEPKERHTIWGSSGEHTRADTLVGYIRGDEPRRETKQKRPEGV